MPVTIHVGDCLDVLRTLPAASVHCVVTSPPYWGLRDYGCPPVIRGGDPACAHEWGEMGRKGGGAGRQGYNGQRAGRSNNEAQAMAQASIGQFCTRCGAWRGQLGLEPSFDLFLANMVEVFAEVRRVLRADGVLWLNMGDSYVTTPNGRSAADTKALGGDNRTFRDKPKMEHGDLKPKQRMMQPARLALALQADGWWLRDEIVWAKPNPMPSSIQDRTTPAHEMIYLLSPRPRYFYDGVAIMEDSVSLHPSGNGYARPQQIARDGRGNPEQWDPTPQRNARSVWKISLAPYAEAHFATFPQALAEKCILAGTSAKGVCPDCGAQWERVTEKRSTGRTQKMADGWATGPGGHGSVHRDGREAGEGGKAVMQTVTTGFRPTCACGDHEPVPATVMDPFGGAGTVGLVAEKLGRNSILIEVKQEYADMARARIRRGWGRVEAPADDKHADLPLFGTEAAE